jgi:hypothetical protein
MSGCTVHTDQDMIIQICEIHILQLKHYSMLYFCDISNNCIYYNILFIIENKSIKTISLLLFLYNAQCPADSSKLFNIYLTSN